MPICCFSARRTSRNVWASPATNARRNRRTAWLRPPGGAGLSSLSCKFGSCKLAISSDLAKSEKTNSGASRRGALTWANQRLCHSLGAPKCRSAFAASCSRRETPALSAHRRTASLRRASGPLRPSLLRVNGSDAKIAVQTGKNLCRLTRSNHELSPPLFQRLT